MIKLVFKFSTVCNKFLLQFLNVPMFRNVTLQCLTEIAGVTVPASQTESYDQQFLTLFMATMGQLRLVS